jgi:hypothetical protein
MQAFSLALTLVAPRSAPALRQSQPETQQKRSGLEEKLRKDSPQFAQLDAPVTPAHLTALPVPAGPRPIQPAGLKDEPVATGELAGKEDGRGQVRRIPVSIYATPEAAGRAQAAGLEEGQFQTILSRKLPLFADRDGARAFIHLPAAKAKRTGLRS